MDRDSVKKERQRRIEICDSLVTPLMGKKDAFPNFKIVIGGRSIRATREYSSRWKFYEKGRVVGSWDATWDSFNYSRDYNKQYYYQMLWDIYEGKFTV
jgi:hypothetical protein